jgi:DNA repair protein RecO (recombination protein O)
MNWKDEGYLLSKNNFNENSIIVDVFTLNHGRYNGLIYGGSSRKNKNFLQIGNKILLNWNSKNDNKMGYFTTELINPVAPLYFDDKKKTVCIFAATSILKILLPERQINKKIYQSFEKFLNSLKYDEWINLYIVWELDLIKELGFELDFNNLVLNNKSLKINNQTFKIPELLLNNKKNIINKKDIIEALKFNKHLLIENFVSPYKLRLPLFRSILEKYFI